MELASEPPEKFNKGLAALPRQVFVVADLIFAAESQNRDFSTKLLRMALLAFGNWI